MKASFIRLVQVIFFIGLSTSNVHANFASLDQIFLENGIVDKNYKYIDKKLAAQVFTKVNNDLANSLPIKFDANTEISSVLHTPNFAIYYYKVDLQSLIGDLPLDGFIEYVREELTSKEAIQVYCKQLFGAKFQQVNGYTFVLNMYDVSGAKITDITLNEKTCPLKNY